MIKIYCNGKLYENCFERVVWSGGMKTSARVLEVDYLHTEAGFKLGNEVRFAFDNKELFVGTVISVDRKAGTGVYTLKAYDHCFRINKNEFMKNYFEAKPSNVAKEIIQGLGLNVGNFPKDVAKFTSPMIGKTGYDIIMTAYSLQKKELAKQGQHKFYSLVCKNNKISVVESGLIAPNVKLASGINIISADYGEDMEDITNKIIVYSEEGGESKVTDILYNNDDIKRFGIFQKVLKESEGTENATATSKAMKSVSRKMTLEVLGNINLMAGYSVPVKIDEFSDLNNIFYINSDTHTWQDNNYTVSLDIVFELTMDEKTLKEQPKEEE
ncbi:MAG: XkdQ/YqbQ family protein, partial [Lactococcus garvieae]